MTAPRRPPSARTRLAVVTAAGALLVAACGGPTADDGPGDDTGATPGADSAASAAPTPDPTPTGTTPDAPADTAPPTSGKPWPHPRPADPDWAFFERDKRLHRSPWFFGRGRLMIDYGCTRAPYYDPSPRCPGSQGFHHGVDIALPCGTRLYAGLPGRVIPRSTPGTPGSAYGARAFRIRTTGGRFDMLVGHPGRVLVREGQRVRKGQLIARASDDGAPDGCHLHFEVRPAGGQYTQALNPHTLLGLRPHRHAGP